MTQEQIKIYRDKIETQLKEKITDFEKNLSIATIASIGFFLTINEKFIGLLKADYKCLMIISASSFIITLGILLLHSLMTANADKKILKLLDNHTNGTTPTEDTTIYNEWQDHDGKLNLWRDIAIVFFFVGFVTQVLFFLLNTSKEKEDKKDISETTILVYPPQTLSIGDSAVLIKIDSIKLKTY